MVGSSSKRTTQRRSRSRNSITSHNHRNNSSTAAVVAAALGEHLHHLQRLLVEHGALPRLMQAAVVRGAEEVAVAVEGGDDVK
jgi:hypothetical protein